MAGSSAQTLRQRDPAVRGWLPLELERRHRRGDALQLQATERTEAMTVTRARELAHQSIDDDLPTRRVRAEPRGLDHRLAEVIAVLDRGVTHAHSDPHPEPLRGATVARLDSLLHSGGWRNELTCCSGSPAHPGSSQLKPRPHTLGQQLGIAFHEGQQLVGADLYPVCLTGAHQPLKRETPRRYGGETPYRQRDSNPCYRRERAAS